ncbi:FxSxx-COOH system tetratricopeptide repeat protein [Streptomyces sp. NPDC058695]|uniref:FxSxx-COOH system tetratricopeptide repeat protein n=1 Tax=Streptomyces sp. NPDC058695 TaxID=3346604 RepID=UPI00365052FE
MIEASGSHSIAAHSINVAVTGDNARVVSLPETALRWAQETSAPHGFGFLPRPASHTFLGRETELKKLRGMLTANGESALTPEGVGALHGLGGVGKSSLALHYAHQFRDEYTLIWWITAGSAEQIQAGLASLAQHLCPQWAPSADQKSQAAWAALWLQWHPGWLIIFDNVEDPIDLASHWGSLTSGHRIATSRKATGWQSIGPTMTIGVLDAESATDLLCDISFAGLEPTAEQAQHSGELARELGYLPLALEQAGAYLQQTGSEIDEYRRDLGLLLDDAGDGIDPERTIARIWKQTLKVIESRTPLAVSLLQAIAWLAPDGIPRNLLSEISPDTRSLNHALGVLNAYSMITFSALGELTVHRLVQAVLRTSAPHADSPAGLEDAEKVVLKKVYPEGSRDPASPEDWAHLIPHVLALASNTPREHTSPEMQALYSVVAHHMNDQDQLARAIPIYYLMASHSEAQFGKTHSEALRNRINLAVAYQSTGNHQRAIPLFEEILADSEQALGPEHPQTLVASNNLGHACEAAGDVKRATSIHQKTLGMRTQVLGASHPETLTSLNNLAYSYETSGNLREAIRLYRESLQRHQQELGETHLQTLHSRFNLARACLDSGNLSEALPLHEETLTQRRELLGENHPKTLDSLNEVARAFQFAGKIAKAIELHRMVLGQRMKILGPMHPSTLQSMNNLAFAYQEKGDLDRAIEHFISALRESVRGLGDTHPMTLKMRHNLAFTYQQKGDFERAIPLSKAVLFQREEVLSQEHPETLMSRHNLANAYRESGDAEKAIELFRENLIAYDRTFGEKHQYSSECRHGLALCYEETGDTKAAISLFKEALHNSRHLGETHEKIVAFKNNLARSHYTSGDQLASLKILRDTAKDCEDELGADHPNTLKTRLNLAATFQRSGNLKRAIKLYEATLPKLDKVLGKLHPQTLQGRNNLGVAYGEIGEVQRGVLALTETLAQCREALGDTHPQTMQCSRNLAYSRQMV